MEATSVELGRSEARKGGYDRFKIENHAAPPRRREPRPFTPRVSRSRLAAFLVQETVELGFKLRRSEYRKVLFTRPCIYGVFSGRFGGFKPIRERCTGCMRCVQEYPSMCRVSRNPEFYKFADSYWVPKDPSTATASSMPVATVSYEAATGKIPVKGMGYRGGFAEDGWDSIWTDMSEIVRPTRDGVYGREFISTLVDIGRKEKFLEFSSGEPPNGSKAIQIPIPIIFDYLPESMNGASISNSIALASSLTGTIFLASPEQVRRLSTEHREQMVPLLTPSSVEEDRDVLLEAPMIELTDYDQTAIEEVRELNLRAPVSVRLPLTKHADNAAVEFARNGVDVIHLFANYHGEGWDTENPGFVGDLIRTVHGALVKEALRDEVTLIASGGITLAEHVPKAIICGADLVALDTTVLVALQSQFQGECRSPQEGRIIPEGFDVSWGGQRLVNLLASWHDQLIEILSAMGMRDVRRLRGDVGRALFKEDLEKEAFADIQHGT